MGNKLLFIILFALFFAGKSVGQYSLHISENGSGSGIVKVNGSSEELPFDAFYSIPTNVNLEAVPDGNSVFDGWSGDASGTENPTNLIVNSNKSVTVAFQKKFTVTTSVNPTIGGSISGIANGGVYSDGATASLTANPATGYEFVNWTSNGNILSSNTTFSFTVSSDTNLVANFALIQYTVLTSVSPAESGSITGLSVGGVYNYGDQANLTAVPAAGYEFSNWTEGGFVISTNANLTFTVTGDRNITANFTIKTYSVNLISGGVGSGEIMVNGVTYNLPYSEIFDYSTNLNIEAVPSTGSQFDSWSGDLTGVINPTNITVDADKNITVNFIYKKYNLNIISGENGKGQIKVNNILENLPYTGSFDYNSIINLEAVPSFGSEFSSWTGALNNSDNPTIITIIEDQNVTANFSLIQYSLEISDTGSGSGQIKVNNVLNDLPYTGTFDYSSVVNLEAVPGSSSVFSGWGGDLIGDTNPTDLTINNDKNVITNFTKTYILSTSVNPSGSGTITGVQNNGVYAEGSTATLEAKPSNQYDFVNWTGTSTGSDSILAITMDGNQNVTANFVLRRYTINFTKGGQGDGKVKVNGIIHDLPYSEKFNAFSQVSIEGLPSKGSHFHSWSGGLNSSDNPNQFIVLWNRDITVNFDLNNYQITTNKEPNEGGTVSGGGTFAYGHEVTILAVANVGYRFVNWSENGKAISQNSSYTFLVDTTHVYQANFALKTYEITVNGSPRAGGNVTGTATYTHGDTVHVIASPNSSNGYDFINWTENGNEVSKNLDYSFIATESRDLIANFKLRTYSINLSVYPQNSGSVTGQNTYTHGQSVTAKATPNAGWLFVNWTENDVNVSNDAEYTFSALSNRNLKANFAKDIYTISAVPDPIDGGNISGAGQFYYGQTATLIIKVNVGWEFVSWTNNGTIVSTDTAYVFQVSGNLNLKANFKMKDYFINCSSNPTEAGFTSGCGIARYNQSMTVKAEATNGWEFKNWTENGIIVSDSSTFQFTVKKDKDLIANFTLVTGIEQNEFSNSIPDNYYLTNAYPNPFNPETSIQFGLPEQSMVSLLIFDITGRIVGRTIDNVNLPAGNYINHINGTNWASGIYIYTLNVKSSVSDKYFRKTGKLVLLK